MAASFHVSALIHKWFLVGAAAAALKSPEAPGATIPQNKT